MCKINKGNVSITLPLNMKSLLQRRTEFQGLQHF
jgi:hypothetical protein